MNLRRGALSCAALVIDLPETISLQKRLNSNSRFVARTFGSPGITFAKAAIRSAAVIAG